VVVTKEIPQHYSIADKVVAQPLTIISTLIVLMKKRVLVVMEAIINPHSLMFATKMIIYSQMKVVMLLL
jgi:hypothetical protein